MIAKKCRVQAAILALLGVGLCIAPPAGAEWQGFRAAQNGIVDDRVTVVVEAADGPLWFGTRAGVSVFNGQSWMTVGDSLPEVSSIIQDRSGAWWIGTRRRGLARLDASGWSYFDQITGELPANAVGSLIEDRDGDIWVGTAAGLVRHRLGANTWATYGPGSLIDAHANWLCEDRLGQLWVGGPEGASMLDSTRTTWAVFPQDPIRLGRDSILSMADDATGRVWFGTDSGAYIRDESGSWSRLRQADGLPTNTVLSLCGDRRGGMWIGTSSGLAHYDGRTIRAFLRTSEGAFLGAVQSLFLDSSGNLWIGTTSAGVFRFDGVQWLNFFAPPTTECLAGSSPNIPSDERLGSNCMSAMLQDRAGDLWFGTVLGGVSRFDRTGRWWPIYHRVSGRPLSDSISTMIEDRARTLWFGSPGSGLAALDSTRLAWTLHRRATGIASDTVLSTFVDAAGDVWVGTSNGLSRRRLGAWSTYRPAPELEVQAMIESDDGTLWVRTTTGLWTVDPTRAAMDPVTEAIPYAASAGGIPSVLIRRRSGQVVVGGDQGLAWYDGNAWTTKASFINAFDTSVHALLEDRDGHLWVGTDYGAARFNGVDWTYFTSSDLGGAPVNQIFQDSSGVFWFGTGTGTAVGRDSWRLIGPGSGPPSDVIIGFLEDSQGSIWLASDKGLAVHTPDRTAPQSVFVAAPRTLVPARTVAFVFGAAFGEFSDLEFSSHWDNEPFSDWTKATATSRSGLEDGVHTFEVISRDRLQNTDPTPARFTIEVDATPPTALLSAPSFGQPVRGVVTIAGAATDARFHDFRVQVRRFGATTWTPKDATTLVTATSPVDGDTLTTWDTTVLADGDWELRLAVADTLGLVAVSLVRVVVDNVAPFANVTTPARIVAGDGGDIYTTNAEVHLYVPPGAFNRDATVTIVAEDSLPPAPGRAAGDPSPPQVGPAWHLDWNAELVKDGVLEMKPPAGTPGSALSIWKRRPDNTWAPLGGSFDAARGVVALSIHDPAVVALFQTAVPTNSGSVTQMSLTPRVFSTSGGYATSEVAIGFTLQSSGSVTVKVYNRAGRMMRIVSDHLSLGAGANLVRWDGRDRDGETVAPGMYLVTVEAGGDTQTKTLGVVR